MSAAKSHVTWVIWLLWMMATTFGAKGLALFLLLPRPRAVQAVR